MREVTEACWSLDQIVIAEVSVEAMQRINCQNVLKRKENTIKNFQMYINLVLYEAMPTFLKCPSTVCSNRVTTADQCVFDNFPIWDKKFYASKKQIVM